MRAAGRRADHGDRPLVDAIERARRRNLEHISRGRAVLLQAELADLDAGATRFDRAVAVNVNVFWTTSAEDECAVLRRVLRPGGLLHLVYEGPTPRGARDVGPTVAGTLGRQGFTPEVIRHPSAPMVCITGAVPG